jgi:exopolysaccharide biosynthesis protein
MTEKNQDTVRPRRRKKKKDVKRTIINVVVRTLISIVTVAGVLLIGACLILNLMFNGPSPAARDVLTMSLKEASATKWIPALFLGKETVSQIENGGKDLFADDDSSLGGNAQMSNPGSVQIDTSGALNSTSDEWKDYPDGIRIENVSGDTYNAYVMIVRDPSAVYLATSTEKFSMSIPGTRITDQIETEGAIAAVNAGAFFDNGTSSPSVGSVPEGLVISQGKVVWETGKAPQEGFVGFNKDNVLVVAHSMTADKAMEMGIRDGCCFGPVLIMDGQINEKVYNINSGYNPRTAIGQRADGAVILLCIDGRQAGSLGGTYADIINIMVEYDAVNACNLDGGSSTVMLYRDNYGRYGAAGQVQMINNYSLLQEKPRKMPTFIMVRPSKEG